MKASNLCLLRMSKFRHPAQSLLVNKHRKWASINYTNTLSKENFAAFSATSLTSQAEQQRSQDSRSWYGPYGLLPKIAFGQL